MLVHRSRFCTHCVLLVLILASALAGPASALAASSDTPPTQRPIPSAIDASNAASVTASRPSPPLSRASVTPLIVPPAPAPARQLASAAAGAISSERISVPAGFPAAAGKWIDVDLGEQRMIAYEGETPIRTFSVSTGMAGTPTVQGAFRIYMKTPLQDMKGGERELGTYYNLPNVPWVQYFYAEYSFHGTYWHDNFGHPMSHGCVNMRNEDAKWLFDWTTPGVAPTAGKWHFTRSNGEDPGTLVLIHD